MVRTTDTSKRPHLFLVMMVLFSGMFTAACKSNEASAPIGDTEDTDTADLVTGQLEILSWWNAPGEVDALSALLNLFQDQYPSVNVVELDSLTAKYESSAELNLTLLNDEVPPDITVEGPLSSLTYRAFQGNSDDNRLEPLDDLYEKAGWQSDIPAEVLDALTSV